jgi:cell division protein FtsB
MAASRRPDPSRSAARSAARASARRAQAGRSAAADPSTGRRPPPAAAARRSGRAAGLTTRAAILGLIVCALVVSAALPLREYLAQRGEIGRLEQQQAQQRDRVEALEAAKRQLEDPAFAMAEARRRLHFVLPGETAYVLIAPEPGQAPAGANAEPLAETAGPEAPWFSQLWSSVQEADRVSDPDAPADPAVPPVPEPAAPR